MTPAERALIREFLTPARHSANAEVIRTGGDGDDDVLVVLLRPPHSSRVLQIIAVVTAAEEV